jgi:hypothetical protein
MTFRTSVSIAILFLILRAAEANTQECRIPADPDILGLGVRLGLYFQLAANGIIVALRPEDGVASLKVSNMLFTGLYVSIIHSTLKNDLPPGLVLAALSILPLDFILIIPISMLLVQETRRKLSYWTVSLCLLRVWCHRLSSLVLVSWTRCGQPVTVYGPPRVLVRKR